MTDEAERLALDVAAEAVMGVANRREIVLASHVIAHADRIAALEAQLAEARRALEFYRDEWRFTTNKRYGGLEWKPTEKLLDDCGNAARAALASAEKPGSDGPDTDYDPSRDM